MNRHSGFGWSTGGAPWPGEADRIREENGGDDGCCLTVLLTIASGMVVVFVAGVLSLVWGVVLFLWENPMIVAGLVGFPLLVAALTWLFIWLDSPRRPKSKRKRKT